MVTRFVTRVWLKNDQNLVKVISFAINNAGTYFWATNMNKLLILTSCATFELNSLRNNGINWISIFKMAKACGVESCHTKHQCEIHIYIATQNTNVKFTSTLPHKTPMWNSHLHCHTKHQCEIHIYNPQHLPDRKNHKIIMLNQSSDIL